MIQIFVKCLQSRTIALDIDPNGSVENLKNVIQDKERIPAKLMRLEYCCKLLANNSLLSSYNIQRSSILVLSLKLKRGMQSLKNFIGL